MRLLFSLFILFGVMTSCGQDVTGEIYFKNEPVAGNSSNILLGNLVSIKKASDSSYYTILYDHLEFGRGYLTFERYNKASTDSLYLMKGEEDDKLYLFSQTASGFQFSSENSNGDIITFEIVIENGL